MPKIKTLSRKSIVKKLDKEFSIFIRNRDRKCVICGTTKNLQCGHLFSRVAYSTRWDEKNCHCQCAGCNLKHEFDAYPFTKFFLEKFGQKQYDLLHFKYASPSKFPTWELEQMYLKYKMLNNSESK